MLQSTSESGPNLSRERLEEVQEQLGIKFPLDYASFLLAHNGGRPRPASFLAHIDGVAAWMRVHFFFGIDDPVMSCDLLWNHKVYVARIPKLVIPIAKDEAGNRFCLDLRGPGPKYPVLFWDHETEALGAKYALRSTIAESFNHWIDALTQED